MSQEPVTIGCDPELFVFNTKTEEFLSGHNLIEGSKDKPFEVIDGAYQRDGVAVEINIVPAKTPEEFCYRINSVIGSLTDAIHTKSKDYTLLAVPVADFPGRKFARLPAQVKALGCDPEFSAYTGEPIDKILPNTFFRTGGGHVHIGYGTDLFKRGMDHWENCRALSRALDVTLMIPSLLWDTDDRRRQLYGSPGAHRPKQYGVEYRSLSNAWITHEGLKRYVFNTTMKTVKLFREGYNFEIFGLAPGIIDVLRQYATPDKEDVIRHYTACYEAGLVDRLPDQFV